MLRNKRFLVFSLVALLSTGLAYTQSKAKFIEEEGTEHYDMPPAPPMRPLLSPRIIVPMGGYTSYQINVNNQGLNIVGDAANEPSMTVDPTNPNRIAVGWRQFNSVSSNFRQGGYGYSTDGGLTWTFPGVLENNVFRSDPVLATTLDGTFHYNSLRETFFSDEYRSINQGQSWTNLGPATGGDKQWITIDKTNGTGSGFVYQIWSTAGNNYGGRQFSRSTNGGSTWMNPINLPNQPVWGTLDVGPDGNLHIVGTDGNQPSLRYLRSSNAQNGGVTPTFDRAVFVDMGGDLIYGPTVNPDGLGGQAWIAVDKGNGPNRGNIYILASVGVNGSNPCEVRLRRSTDGGATWGPVVRVNDDPVNQGRYHWFGTLSVAPNGRVDACWLDTRSDSTNTNSRLYYTYSTDGGQTFAPNIAISAPFNSRIGWPQQNKIGDYMAMHSDNSGANIVYPATFSGGQDIYFVRVPQETSQQILPETYSLFRGQLVSGGLSDLFSVDAGYLVGKAGLVLNVSEEPLQVIVEGTSPTSAPTALSFTAVTKANAATLEQKVMLFNFTTASYETVDTRATTLADQTVTVSASGDLSRFVNSGDRKLRAKVAFRQVAPVAVPWNVSLNQTVWDVAP